MDHPVAPRKRIFLTKNANRLQDMSQPNQGLSSAQDVECRCVSPRKRNLSEAQREELHAIRQTPQLYSYHFKVPDSSQIRQEWVIWVCLNSVPLNPLVPVVPHKAVAEVSETGNL